MTASLTPGFALTLSHDGVSLLHRDPRGWLTVGEVALDDPALDARLAALRETGLSLVDGAEGMTTKLVIPPSEVLFTDVPSPGPDPLQREAAIRTALEGATPYAVADLVFDWSGNGDRLRVAVVARQTLREAEAFAAAHGFRPVSYVARATPEQFPGEPFFGRTEAADALIGAGVEVARDILAVEVVGRARRPAAAVKAIFARTAPGGAAGLGEGPSASPTADAARAPTTQRPADTDATPAPEETRDGDSAPATAAADDPAGPTDGQTPAPAASAPTPPAPAAPAPAAPAPAAARPSATPDPAPAAGSPPTQDADAQPPKAGRPPQPPGTSAHGPKPAAATRAEAGARAAAMPRVGAATMRSGVTDTGPATPPPPKPDAAKAETAPAPARGTPSPATDRAAAPAARSDVPDAPAGSAADRPVPPPDTAPTAPRTVAVRGAGATLHPATPAGTTTAAPAPEGAAPRDAATDTEPDGAPPPRPVLAETLRARSSQPLALDGSATEAEAMTVFGARRSPPPAPSARTGLAVTAALALMLAGAGVWAAFFLSAPEPQAQLTDPVSMAGDTAPPQDAAPADPLVNAPADTADAPADTAADTRSDNPLAPAAGADTAMTAPADLMDGWDALALDAPDSPPRAPTPEAVPAPQPASAVAVPPFAEPAPAQAPRTPAAPPPLDRLLADSGVDAAALSGEAAVVVEVVEGAPDILPVLRRTERSRYLLIEGDLPVPATAEPLPRPPGLGGDGALRDAEPAVPDGPAAAVPAQTRMADGRAASLWPGAAAEDAPPPPAEADGPATAALTVPPDPPVQASGDAGLASISASAAGLVRSPAARPATLAVPAGPTHLVIRAPADNAARPSLRPGSVVDLAAAVRSGLAEASDLAVDRSPRPGTRPTDFAAVVARATRPATPAAAAPTPTRTAAVQPAATAPATVAAAPQAAPQAAQPAAPALPTRASVAQQATETRALNLRRINLIGVFGTSGSRRALVRLSNGQIVAVRVGDRLDGGQVAAIGDGELRYVRNGRNTLLRIGG